MTIYLDKEERYSRVPRLQIPVTHLMGPKGNGDMQAAKRDSNAPPTGGDRFERYVWLEWAWQIFFGSSVEWAWQIFFWINYRLTPITLKSVDRR